jgi:hypothetical protein
MATLPFGLDQYAPGGSDAAGASIAATMGALGKFADAYGQIYSNSGQGLASAYGSLAGGLGNIGTAMANERSNFYGANAMAEAARQGALGNIATAGLSAYGGAANSAMGAWAQNQAAYNDAMSKLGVANQQGLAGYGASRNNALGQLGSAYSGLGGKLAAAGALQGLNFNFGGSDGGGGNNTFSASGPDGQIASGGYGGGGGGSWGGGAQFGNNDFSRYADPAYAGLGSLQGNLMAGDITGGMNNNLQDGYNRLDLQHYTSRNMPSQMLGQTLSGLMQLSDRGYGESRGGMNQYYDTQNNPANRADYSGLPGSLASGFNNVSSQLSNLYSTAMQGGGGALRDLFDSSLGKTGVFKSQFERGEDRRKDEAAERLKNFARTYGGVPKREQLVGDRYGLANYYPVLDR